MMRKSVHMILRVLPFILAFLLLAAHFFRSAHLTLVALCLLTPLLLLIKKRSILIFLQCLAYVGALIWVRTAYVLVHQRIGMAEPWGRMVLILSGVAVFTFLAGYLLNSDLLKQHYQ
jgi:ABC-type Fe3+-siderophore transport system permease subunit